MSAQEYYQSFQKQQRPNPAPFQNSPPAQPQQYGPGPRTSSGSLNAPSQQPYPNPPYPVTPGAIPPQSSPIPPYPVSDLPPTQFLAPPQPTGPGQSYFPPQTQLSSSYGPRPSDPYAYPPAAPLALQRSTSEPPENRRTSLAPPPHRHPPRRDSYDSDESETETRDLERSGSGSGSRSRSRARSHHSRGSSDRSRSDRNTFLGAGGGALVGDAIFPGLGTIGGLLLGGLGGHEYARRRSRSEMAERREGAGHHHHHHKHEGGKKEYGDGVTVVSEWGLIQR